jgi:hypothetical protein
LGEGLVDDVGLEGDLIEGGAEVVAQGVEEAEAAAGFVAHVLEAEGEFVGLGALFLEVAAGGDYEEGGDDEQERNTDKQSRRCGEGGSYCRDEKATS